MASSTVITAQVEKYTTVTVDEKRIVLTLTEPEADYIRGLISNIATEPDEAEEIRRALENSGSHYWNRALFTGNLRFERFAR